MPSAASFARSIRARERIDLETCAPGSSHGPPPSFDLPQTWSFHLCGRSARGCQSASEAIGEAPQAMARRISGTRGPWPVSITAHSWEPPTAVTVPPAPMKEKTVRVNLDNGQRSALLCGPRKVDKTAHREAVAVIHASSGLPSGHISLLGRT